MNDRSVICQGVLNPTVFNAEDRITNTPFAQSSWYFRPYVYNNTPSQSETQYHYNYNIEPQCTVSSSIPAGEDLADNNFRDNLTYVYALFVKDIYGELRRRNLTSIKYTETTTYANGQTQQQVKTIPIITTLEFEDHIFALVSQKIWPEVYIRYQGDVKYSGSYDTSIQNSQIVGYSGYIQESPSSVYHSTMVYSGLVAVSGNPLHYIKPESISADVAVMKFLLEIDGHQYLYVATYNAINTEDIVVSDQQNDLSSKLAFTHYTSLPDYNDNNTDYAQEIQGALNRYTTIDTSNQLVGRYANTQFFIDQSIVTLNSPDIEFDTDVQNFKEENVSLRIVGIIPITGSVSNHKITSTALPKDSSGIGEIPQNIVYNNFSIWGSNRFVSGYIWNDAVLNSSTSVVDTRATYKVYPWHKQGSLNNDNRPESEATSVLQTKKESALLYSIKSEYVQENTSASNPQYITYPNINVEMCLQENTHIYNTRLKKQTTGSQDHNYYANVDRILTNENGYHIEYSNILSSSMSSNIDDITYYNPVSMRYHSGTHAVIVLQEESHNNIDYVPTLPYIKNGSDYLGTISNTSQGNTRTASYETPIWGGTAFRNRQEELNVSSFKLKGFNLLLLGELYRPANTILNRFGGDTEAAIKSNNWQIGGDTVDISTKISEEEEEEDTILLKWTYGDTFYQRYDCLKTFAYSDQDTNQLVEILSFMCETHVNADGRYDPNRGQIDNTVMSPKNFNNWNPVYSQSDNYFTYKVANTDTNRQRKYPNQITWSLPKNSGAEVDTWTNITLANTMELDGDKGEISKLVKFKDQLIAFQDTGISTILYNEKVQISTEQGVPIEIANSNKVQGKKYISDTIGSSNKWAVTQTPSSVYFIDNNDKNIYRLGESLYNVSVNHGFNAWCKQNVPSMEFKWNPDGFKNFVSYYDKYNQEVIFISDKEALAFSEKLNTFTSFYSYNDTPYLCNFNDTGIWIRKDSSLWKHQASEEYCSFFNEIHPYSLTLIANQEPQIDKVFTNLEFRASIMGDLNPESLTPILPFESIETWNEYQHGKQFFAFQQGHPAFTHYASIGNDSYIKRKFRIWRCDLPRDNVIIVPNNSEDKPSAISNLAREAELGISRYKQHPLDRMRNPWIYVDLKSQANNPMSKIEIHDMMLTYYR